MKINFLNDLSREILKLHLNYDPLTGIFTRKISLKSSIKIGDIAGTHCGKGYRKIAVTGKIYTAHRLAWLYVYGEFPKQMIDHINGIKDDNRFANLREASGSNNQHNVKLRASNTSGYKGVYWNKQVNKWQARCEINGKCHLLGYFDDPKLASDSYENFAKSHHGIFYKDSRVSINNV